MTIEYRDRYDKHRFATLLDRRKKRGGSEEIRIKTSSGTTHWIPKSWVITEIDDQTKIGI